VDVFQLVTKYSSREWTLQKSRGQRWEVKVTARPSALLWRRHTYGVEVAGGEVWSGECPRAVVWSCPVQSMLTMSRDCASHCAAAAVADKPASRQSSCIRTHQPRYVTSLASAVSMCCMRRHETCARTNCNSLRTFTTIRTKASTRRRMDIHTVYCRVRLCYWSNSRKPHTRDTFYGRQLLVNSNLTVTVSAVSQIGRVPSLISAREKNTKTKTWKIPNSAYFGDHKFKLNENRSIVAYSACDYEINVVGFLTVLCQSR